MWSRRLEVARMHTTLIASDYNSVYLSSLYPVKTAETMPRTDKTCSLIHCNRKLNITIRWTKLYFGCLRTPILVASCIEMPIKLSFIRSVSKIQKAVLERFYAYIVIQKDNAFCASSTSTIIDLYKKDDVTRPDDIILFIKVYYMISQFCGR